MPTTLRVEAIKQVIHIEQDFYCDNPDDMNFKQLAEKVSFVRFCSVDAISLTNSRYDLEFLSTSSLLSASSLACFNVASLSLVS